MEEPQLLNSSRSIADSIININCSGIALSDKNIQRSPAIDELISDGGENFYRYLAGLGLINDPNLLVLSSKRHYYYDHSELKLISTLIVLKKLNVIKYIDVFLDALHEILAPGTNFLGYFYDTSSNKVPGLFSNLYKGFIDILDSKTDIKYDSESISEILDSHGFKVIDMTLINGLTYFRTQNVS